jgi:hypothetical protein
LPPQRTNRGATARTIRAPPLAAVHFSALLEIPKGSTVKDGLDDAAAVFIANRVVGCTM